MKKLFGIIFLLCFAIMANAQAPTGLQAPKGLVTGKWKSGSSIIRVDSILQFSTDQYRLYKGASLMSPYLPLLFKINGSATTPIGNNLMLFPNPNAIGFYRINANNTLTFRTPVEVLIDIGGVATADLQDPATIVPLLADSNLIASPNGYATPKLVQVGLATKVTKATMPTTIGIACSDETTALTASTSVTKVTFRMPYAMTVTAVRASVTTAPTDATILVDIHESGTTILSTKMMIDATELTSTTATTPYVIADAALADDASITVFVDQIGSTVAGAGLKIWIIGTRVAP